MSATIVKPQAGHVTITVPYEEAEYMLRVLGATNYGNVRTGAPVLLQAIDAMVEVFGRNGEGKLRAVVENGQVYVVGHDDFDDFDDFG